MAVISCGKLQKTSTEKNTNGPISSFQVKIEPSYCSTICVVAYYETECGGSSAIISDYLCTDVEEQCSNNVGFTSQLVSEAFEFSVDQA